VWSFPGFGIIMMINFFHLLVIALNSWHMVPTAHSGCSCSFIIFMTLHGRNTIGSAIGKSSSACDLILRTIVGGFGWNTFLRWTAN